MSTLIYLKKPWDFPAFSLTYFMQNLTYLQLYPMRQTCKTEYAIIAIFDLLTIECRNSTLHFTNQR